MEKNMILKEKAYAVLSNALCFSTLLILKHIKYIDNIINSI